MKAIRKKVTIIGLIMLLSVLFLTACGELKTEEELLKYAKSHYGKVQHIRTEEDEKHRTVYVKDKKYGFEYSLTTYIATFGMDGSSMDLWAEISSNHDEVYFDYLVSEVAGDTGYTLSTEKSGQDYYVYTYGKLTEGQKEEVCKAIHKKDKKKVFNNVFYVCDDAADEDGRTSYDPEENAYLDKEATEAGFYLRQIEEYGGPKPKYTRLERVDSYKKIPRFPVADYVAIYGETDEATIYYFTINKKEYFICNKMVIDTKGGCKYYTNYIQ